MSELDTQDFNCPRCGAKFSASTAETINVTRMPSARDRILDGSFHVFACEACGERITIDRTFLYTDLRREQFIHVFPTDHVADWPQWEEVAGQTFWQAFEPAPPMMREVAGRFQVRAVFGLAQLADKLRIWDAGLDDAVVELHKLELVTSSPALAGRGDVAVDVVAVGPELIEVAATSLLRAWPEERYGLTLSRYRELAAAREELVGKFPGLFHKPFVGFRRLARETVVGERS